MFIDNCCGLAMLPFLRFIAFDSLLTVQGARCSPCAAITTINIRRELHISSTLLKGHSKWQNIKATKSKNDDLRSKRINEYLKKIKNAVKDGFDTKFNKRLADLERDYLKESLPMETFKNTLKRLKETPDVSVTYQVIGPGGSLFVVELEGPVKAKLQNTMNKCLKKIPGFRLTNDLLDTQFEEKGQLIVKAVNNQSNFITLEEMEAIGIEIDCEEITDYEDSAEMEDQCYELICDKNSLYRIESKLTELNFNVIFAEPIMRLLGERVKLKDDDTKKIEQFYQILEESEFVKQISDNIEGDEN